MDAERRLLRLLEDRESKEERDKRKEALDKIKKEIEDRIKEQDKITKEAADLDKERSKEFEQIQKDLEALAQTACVMLMSKGGFENKIAFFLGIEEAIDRFTRLKDARDVAVGSTNASLFAYVADAVTDIVSQALDAADQMELTGERTAQSGRAEAILADMARPLASASESAKPTTTPAMPTPASIGPTWTPSCRSTTTRPMSMTTLDDQPASVSRISCVTCAEMPASTARSCPRIDTCSGLPLDTVLYAPICVSSMPAMRASRSRSGPPMPSCSSLA